MRLLPAPLLLGSGQYIIVHIPQDRVQVFRREIRSGSDFGDFALSGALHEVVKLSREMELPPPHVLLQLDAIIVAQRESDGARVVATPSAAATPRHDSAHERALAEVEQPNIPRPRVRQPRRVSCGEEAARRTAHRIFGSEYRAPRLLLFGKME